MTQLIKTVMSSAAKTGMGALFLNALESIPAQKTLIQMGHSQGKTPIETDAHSAVNNNMQCKKMKF